jgi:hypothetical protein
VCVHVGVTPSLQIKSLFGRKSTKLSISSFVSRLLYDLPPTPPTIRTHNSADDCMTDIQSIYSSSLLYGNQLRAFRSIKIASSASAAGLTDLSTRYCKASRSRMIPDLRDFCNTVIEIRIQGPSPLLSKLLLRSSDSFGRRF